MVWMRCYCIYVRTFVESEWIVENEVDLGVVVDDADYTGRGCRRGGGDYCVRITLVYFRTVFSVTRVGGCVRRGR